MKSDNVSTIYQYIKDNISLSLDQICFGNNSNYKPTDTYIKIVVLDGNESQNDLGDSANFRTTGIISIDVNTLSNTGTKDNDDLIDELKSLFFRKIIGYTYIRNISTNELGQTGQYYRQNISIEYYYDTLRSL